MKICKRLGVSANTKLVIEDGRDVDMSILRSTVPIPKTSAFKYIKYFKAKTKRWG